VRISRIYRSERYRVTLIPIRWRNPNDGMQTGRIFGLTLMAKATSSVEVSGDQGSTVPKHP
jgi:hypothetical protein